MANKTAATAEDKRPKGTKISQADIPSISLQKAQRIPKAIAENYGSQPTRPIDVAAAVQMTPSSGPFRAACGAALGYGLTEGGPNAPQIALTTLGRRIEMPTEIDDDKRALREAALKPTIAQKFYSKYDGFPLPPKNIAQNVLGTFDVPVDRTSAVYDLLIENARYVGFIKQIKDKDYIDTGAPIGSTDSALAPSAGEQGSDAEQEAADTAQESNDVQTSIDPLVKGNKNAIFVGHGSNRKPMEQLAKILTEYGIPHKKAVEEANRARPIPQKVAEVMRECGAAILVFTADREYFDKEGGSIWRPSENVSHELGAASVLYGDRIIVFKESGIELPSNFSSVGYIEFEKDKLSEKGIELFRELVSMKILSVSVA
ncbi:Predicted nucleotide-binding protein containing TIR-like domain [Mycobacteroides abscessus subsp. massiliense]|uniref:TIR domain-containing protein n=1 Tax=Mycobacteroides abscessus TaxID=36809 RepID=UPI0009CB1861|nr:TIR domain-containing protein [Mycobacteroides abscessus]SKU28575.1 Predicted nucleotide-binding protein containing TIR-like domain [Mycobacteroides abscessus subsp. massiliense]